VRRGVEGEDLERARNTVVPYGTSSSLVCGMMRMKAPFGSGFATNCTGTGDACTGGTCAISTPPGATSQAAPLDAMRAGPAYGSATSRAMSGRAAGFAADGARC
jgi:hypothetical protein